MKVTYRTWKSIRTVDGLADFINCSDMPHTYAGHSVISSGYLGLTSAAYLLHRDVKILNRYSSYVSVTSLNYFCYGPKNQSNKLAQALLFVAYIRKVSSSNFGQDTVYSAQVLSWFSSVPSANSVIIHWITPRPLPFASISAHYSVPSNHSTPQRLHCRHLSSIECRYEEWGSYTSTPTDVFMTWYIIN